MRTLWRGVLVPGLLVLATGLAFHRAFSVVELAVPVVLALVVGVAVGATVASPRVPWPGSAVAVVGGLTLGAAAVVQSPRASGSCPTPSCSS